MAIPALPSVRPLRAGPINAPDRESYARSPRLRVLMGDGAGDGRRDRDAYGVQDRQEIPGALSATVESNTHYRADRFELTFAMNADPAFGRRWWARQAPPMIVDVQIGFAEGEGTRWRSMLIAEVDQFEMHPTAGLVVVNGRDLTARFIEARTQEAFQNQTASEIATILAGRRGLRADVDRTETPVQRYWRGSYAMESLAQFSRVTNEWEMLVSLARHEDCDVWVSGQTLHFKARVQRDPSPWIVRWTDNPAVKSNVKDLRMRRSLTLAKDIEVVVMSFHSRSGQSFRRVARSRGVRAPGRDRSGTGVQRLVFARPNLSEVDAQKVANSLLTDLSRQERMISWSEPGSLDLTQRDMVRLEGTGTDFDQDYFIDSITRRISMQEGFTMFVSAKNRNTESQAIF